MVVLIPTSTTASEHWREGERQPPDTPLAGPLFSAHHNPQSSLPIMPEASLSTSSIAESAHPPFLLALSGPTSSGKTTIANALSTIFPNSFIIHADDFYKTDSQIPLKDGLQDWDCAESVDFEKLWEVLRGVKNGDEVPRDLVHQGGVEDGVHAPNVKGVGEEVIERLRTEVEGWPEILTKRKLVIVDGFLLFGESVRHMSSSIFDFRILLRARYEDAKRRRESRNGYVTLEGFWQDPPGYFDKIVWPNFVKEHRWMFHNEDVEGHAEYSTTNVYGNTEVGPLEVMDGLDGLMMWVVLQLRRSLSISQQSGGWME